MNIPKECLSAISKNDEEADVGNSRTLSCLQPTICKVCGSKGASMHKIKNIYGKKQWFPLCDKCLKRELQMAAVVNVMADKPSASAKRVEIE